MKFQNGDIILTERKNSIFIKGMRFFQKDSVKYGHAMVIIDDSHVMEANICVKQTSIEKVLSGIDSYKVIRLRNLTECDFQTMKKALFSIEGKLYSWKRIVLQLFDQIFRTNYFTRLLTDKKSQVCSSLVAWCYYIACRTKFNNVDWMSCDPDDIDDESTNNPDKWEIVCITEVKK